MKDEECKDKVKVVIWLDPDEFSLLEIATKHYGVSNTDRTPNDMAGIIVRNALRRMVENVQKL